MKWQRLPPLIHLLIYYSVFHAQPKNVCFHFFIIILVSFPPSGVTPWTLVDSLPLPFLLGISVLFVLKVFPFIFLILVQCGI